MIFHLDANKEFIQPLEQTSYTQLSLKESFIETLIMKNTFNMLDEDILIIGKQICDWDKTNERCDLLGIDKNGKLVVIEVKRDGNQHRDKDVTIQSIKYASYFSTYTLKDAVEQYKKYKNIDNAEDAKQEILNFIIDKDSDFEIDNDPRIIIIGKEFSKEVTASVIWLREHKIDIRCISVIPYKNNNDIFIHRKTIIPLEEIENFMVYRKEKDENIKNKQNRMREQQFNIFIQKLNNMISSQISDLQDIPTSTNNISYFYYGYRSCHYEVFVFKNKKAIDIGFHFEGNIDEQEFSNFVSAQEKHLKDINFEILKNNKTQKGCINTVSLPCRFLYLNNEQLEKTAKEVSEKFCQLYNCISAYVNKNLFDRQKTNF